MSDVFETITLCFFVLAALLTLLGLWRKRGSAGVLDRVLSLSLTAAFLLGIFALAPRHDLPCCVACLVGYGLSQFAVAVSFYEIYENREIAHE